MISVARSLLFLWVSDLKHVDFVDFDLIFNLFPFLDIFWNYFVASKN